MASPSRCCWRWRGPASQTSWSAASRWRPHPICWRSSKAASLSPGATAGASATQIPTGSPFLEGQTLTVAGAALLQRVADAVTKVGGSVLSSQVDVQGVQAKDGFVSVLASCEIEFAALQRLLYDLEAGMPYLFIEQFAAQAATTSTGDGSGGRMRLLLVGLRPLGRRQMSVRLAPYLALAADAADRCGRARRQSAERHGPAAEQHHAGAGRHVAGRRRHRAAERSEWQSALGDPALRADRDARPAAVHALAPPACSRRRRHAGGRCAAASSAACGGRAAAARCSSARW